MGAGAKGVGVAGGVHACTTGGGNHARQNKEERKERKGLETECIWKRGREWQASRRGAARKEGRK